MTAAFHKLRVKTVKSLEFEAWGLRVDSKHRVASWLLRDAAHARGVVNLAHELGLITWTEWRAFRDPMEEAEDAAKRKQWRMVASSMKKLEDVVRLLKRGKGLAKPDFLNSSSSGFRKVKR